MAQITFDPTVPPNTESPRNGATRIRNLTAELMAILGLPTLSFETVGGPFIESFDANGAATFVSNSLVQSDPTVPLGIVTQQYAQALVPYAVTAGGDAYTATFPDVRSPIVAGQLLTAKFSQANTTTSPTLNLNGTGAAPLTTVIGGSPAIGLIQASGTYDLVFDDTTASWVLLGAAVTVFPLTGNVSAGGFVINDLGNGAVVGDSAQLGQFPAVNSAQGYFQIPAIVGGSTVGTGTLTVMTVQWGIVAPSNITSGGTATPAVTFPVAFNSACYSVVQGTIVPTGHGQAGFSSIVSGSVTTTGFTYQLGNAAGLTLAIGGYWIAIGQ